MSGLTHSQEKAARILGNRVLVTAPAGGGKTAVIVKRVAHISSAPEGIVIITYTNSAADELAARLLVEDRFVGFCGTLHSFLLRLLQHYGHELTIVSDLITEDIVVDCMEELRIKNPAAVEKFRSERRNLDPYCPPPRDDEQSLLQHRYLEKLEAAKMVDFDGLFWKAERFIQNYSEGAPFTLVGQHPIRHIIVDEAQDLTDQDHRILDLLNDHKANLFLVGDPMQAIFGFRGGMRYSLLRFDGYVHLLTENFRSAREIVAVANRLDTHRSAQCVSPENGTVKCRQFADTNDERQWVIWFLRDRFLKESAYKSTAILVRTNRLANFWITALEDANIPLSLPPAAPVDWDLCTLWLNYASRPNNDILCRAFLKAKFGDQVVTQALRNAVQHELSINEASLNFSPEMGTRDALEQLKAFNVSEESQNIVLALATSQDSFISLPELVLKLRSVTERKEPEGPWIYVGTIHCSPPDEPVLTTKGYKPISELDPASDRLVCLNGRCNQLTRGMNAPNREGRGFPFTISRHRHDGELIVLATQESRTRITPEHRVRVRFDDSFYGKWTVYLMQRGRWWRVGICGTVGLAPYKSGGVAGRLCTEKADSAWVLGVYQTKQEALHAEAVIQARYGLTGLTFEKTHLLKAFDTPELHTIHEEIADMSGKRVEAVFRDFGLIGSWPLYRRTGGGRRRNSLTAIHGNWFETCAANVISGFMQVPTVKPEDFKLPGRPKAFRVTVHRERYSGTVYGLDVPPHRYYVSGGAVVHNSAKGREWDTVILPNFCEGIIPIRNSYDINEERRIAYTAVTRARKTLVVTHAETSLEEYGPRKMAPSRFLEAFTGTEEA